MKATDILLYTDMDGTALTDWDLGPVIPQRNLDALEAFTQAGGLFSVASGRQLESITKWFPKGMINAPVVCSNGALIQDPTSGEILFRRELPRPYLREALEYTRDRLENVTLITADETAIRRVEIQPGIGDADGWRRKVISVEDYLQAPCFKVCYILSDPALMDTVMAEVSRLPSANQVTAVASAPTCLEIFAKGIHKAFGTRQAQKLAGAENRTLVCIGDFYNDREMLEGADIAACPSQSPREIRELCQYICCSNNDGALADLLQKLLA